MLRSFLVILVVFLMVFDTRAYAAERYAACDSCGLCKNTSLSQKGIVALGIDPDSTVYQKPSNWELCFKCLYPTQAAQAQPVVCESTVNVINTNHTPGIVASQNCQSLIISSTSNDFNIKPEPGRFYSDIGCISTGLGKFIDPNSSVDVVKRILDLVMSATGGVGLIFFVKGSIQLMTSRGNPESIRDGKKTLVNTMIGVAFTLFSLFIFRFIAEQTLKIPGLG